MKLRRLTKSIVYGLLITLKNSVIFASNYAYIPSSGDNSVYVIDTSTDRVVKSIRSPNLSNQGFFGVAVSPIDKSLIVTQGQEGTQKPSQVSVIKTEMPYTTAATAEGGSSFGVTIGKDQSVAYFIDNEKGDINKLNLDDITDGRPTVENLGISLRSPFGIARSSTGRDQESPKLYVTEYSDNSLAVIEESTKSIVAKIQVGANPKGLVISPDALNAFVVNSGDNSLSVVDLANFKSSGKIDICSRPFAVTLHPQSQRLFITCQGDNQNANGYVSVVNIPQIKEVKRIKVGKVPSGIALDPSRLKAYVANAGSNTVSVININSRAPYLKKTIRVGNAPIAFGDFMQVGLQDMSSASIKNDIISFVTSNNYGIGWGTYEKDINEKSYFFKVKMLWGAQERHIQQTDGDRIKGSMTGIASAPYSKDRPRIYFTTCASDGGRQYFIPPIMVDSLQTVAYPLKMSKDFCFSAISIDYKKGLLYLGTRNTSKPPIFKCSIDGKFDSCAKIGEADSAITGLSFKNGNGYATSANGSIYYFEANKQIMNWHFDKDITFKTPQNIVYDGTNAYVIPSWSSRKGSGLYKLFKSADPVRIMNWDDSELHNVASDECGNRLVYNSDLTIFDKGNSLIKRPGFDGISSAGYYGRVIGLEKDNSSLWIERFAMTSPDCVFNN